MANIHTAGRSGFIRRGSARRRESLWFFWQFTSATLGASATAILMSSLNAAALALRPFTIVRTRGQLLVISDQSAATEDYIGNYGMAVVSDQAVAVGVTAVPTPATDQGSDLWFLLEQWVGRSWLVGTDFSDSLASREVDSKAMRKVEEGQDVVSVAEAGLGGSGCLVKFTGRMLIKLH